MARKLLITGGAGRIGRVILPGLLKEWSVRCSDVDIEGLSQAEAIGAETVACDVSNPEAVQAAMKGCDAVLHLAAISVEAAPVVIARVNILGTTNILEACRDQGVRRLVFASSNHAVGGYERFSPVLPPAMIDEAAPPWPDSHYGASKVHGEALIRWYVHRPDSVLTAACLRIGTAGFQNIDEIMANERLWSTWLSDRDLGDLISRSLNAETRFGIYYGVSDNRRRFWSLEAARKDLGYEPRDDAEHYAKRHRGGGNKYSFADWQE